MTPDKWADIVYVAQITLRKLAENPKLNLKERAALRVILRQYVDEDIPEGAK